MSTENVETRVVQIQFDNKKFQKEIKKTQVSLDKLNTSMEFKGSKKELKELQKNIDNIETDKLRKGFDDVGESVTRFTVGLKDIIKYKIVGRVIDKMTDSAVRFMRQMSGIDSITAGWAAYEEQITTIGGVVNNVLSKYDGDRTGALSDVTDAMERLQWYADETSFSFETMSNGIRQFTTSGLGVEAATQASMGVTALAGMSKEFDKNKISSAMNAVAKAFQSGSMNLMQWNTLSQTAGIISEDFSKQLLEEAAAQGKLIKSSAGQYRTKKGGKLVTTENIAETLSDDWLTKDILSNVMGNYSAASVQAQKLIAGYEEDTLDETVKNMIDKVMAEENWSELTASHMIEIMKNEEYAKTLRSLGYEFSQLSVQAFESSQQATSASQAIAAVGEAAKAQFQGIFSSIWGDADESAEVWTKLANDLNTMFVGPIYTLRDIFAEWEDLTVGGAADFRETFGNLLDFAVTIGDLFGSAWGEVFGDPLEDGVSLLQKLTLRLKEFSKWLKSNEKVQKAIKTFFKVVLTALKVIGKLISAVFKVIKAFWPVLKLIFEYFGKFVNWLAEGLSKFAKWVKESGLAEKVATKLARALGFIKDILVAIGKWFGSKWDKIKSAWANNGVGQAITNFFMGIYHAFKDGGFSKAVTTTISNFKNVMIALWNALKTIFPKLEQWYNKIASSKIWKTIKTVFEIIWNVIKTFFWAVIETIEDFGKAFKDDPTGSLWTLAKRLVLIIAVLSGLKAIGGLISVFRNLSWMLDAIRAYFRAKTFTMWALVIASIASSMWLLVDAIVSLSEINSQGKLWSSVGAVVTLMVVIGGLVASLIAVTGHFGASNKKIYKAMKAVQRIAIGMAIMMLAVANLADKIDAIRWPAVGKIALVMAIIAAFIGGMIFLTTRAKGTKTAGLIKMLSVLGVFALCIKAIVWALKLLEPILEDQEKYEKGLKYVLGVIGGFVAIFIATAGLGKFKIKASGATLSQNLLTIAAFFASALAALYYISKINVDEIQGKILKTIEFLGLVLGLMIAYEFFSRTIALFGLARFSAAKVVKPVSLATSGLAAIMVAMLAMVLTMKLVEKINVKKMWENLWVVATVFGILALFVVLLNVFSKVSTGSITDDGAKWSRSKTSPVFATMMAVSIAMLAFVLCMKLVEGFSWKQALSAGGKMLIVLVIIGAIAVAIGWSMKGVDKKAFANYKWTLVALVALMIEITFLNEYINKVGGFSGMWRGIVAFVVGLALLTASLVIANKGMRKGAKKTIAPIIAVLVGLSLILAGIIVYGKLVKEVSWSTVINGALMMAIAFAGIIGVLVVIGKMGKQAKQGGMTKSGGKLIRQVAGVIIAMSVLVFAMAVFGKFVAQTSWGTLLSGLGIMAIAFGSIIAILVLCGKLGKKGPDGKSTTSTSWATAIVKMILAMSVIILAIAAMAFAAKGLHWGQLLALMAPLAVVFGAIIALIALCGKIGKKDANGKTTTSTSGMTSAVKIIKAMALVLLALAAVIYVSRDMSWAQLLSLAAVIGVLGGVLIGFIAVSKISKLIEMKDVIKMVIIVGLFMTALLVAAYNADKINSINWKQFAITLGFIAAATLVMGLICAMISALTTVGGVIKMGLIMALFMTALIVAGKHTDLINAINWKQFAITLGFIAAATLVMGLICAMIGALVTIGGVIKMALIMALFMAALLVAAYNADKINAIDWKKFGITLGIIAAAVLALGLICAALGALAAPVFIGILVMTAIIGVLLLFAWGISALISNYGDDISDFMSTVLPLFAEMFATLVDMLTNADPKNLYLAGTAFGKALSKIAGGLFIFGLACMITQDADFGYICDSLGNVARVLERIDANTVKQSGEALGEALEILGKGLARLNGNGAENLIDDVAHIFGGDYVTSREQGLDALVTLFSALATISTSDFTGLSQFLNGLPASISAMSGVDVGKIYQITSAIDGLVAKIRELKNLLQNELVLSLRLDNSSIDALSNFNVNTSSVRGIQSTMAGEATTVENVNNSSIVVNVTNNNTYSDALAYSYDEQRQAQVVYDQVAKAVKA